MSRDAWYDELDRNEKSRPNIRNPLGLPAGSVRAVLTLILVCFTVIQTARFQEVTLPWIEALMIAIANYFTVRRMAYLPEELRLELLESGKLEQEDHPLYFPSHSIRILIVAAFVGLAVYLHSAGRLWNAQSLAILGPVGSYLLGGLAQSVWNLVTAPDGTNEGRIPTWWFDIKACVAIALLISAAGVRLAGVGAQLPFPVEYLEYAALTITLFYFGAR